MTMALLVLSSCKTRQGDTTTYQKEIFRASERAKIANAEAQKYFDMNNNGKNSEKTNVNISDAASSMNKALSFIEYGRCLVRHGNSNKKFDSAKKTCSIETGINKY